MSRDLLTKIDKKGYDALSEALSSDETEDVAADLVHQLVSTHAAARATRATRAPTQPSQSTPHRRRVTAG